MAATADSTIPSSAAPTEAYRVVARRYRPQRFDELVGQEHVARGLSGAIESGRIGHAYLFTGARGVGKTSAARIFAKALECATGPAAEPCNQCDTCAAIAAGQDVDVVEIDAASNRGIDEIRSLRQNVAVRPARGRFKIYIIDEVHMLTREAFNALLKTLEEPPGHVKFVLCTTEPEKLPITILSRCQRFDFVTVDAPAIARRLGQIVTAEGATVTDDALALIARRAAGSLRDSQSLLEQLLGSSAGAIGIDDVHAVIGTGREERIGALLGAIANRDPAAALAALDESLAGGADPGGVLEQLLGALRDCLVASVGCGPALLLQGDGLGIDLAATGRLLGTETVLAMLQILDQSLSRMRTSGHAGVLAEMAIVRLARLDDLDQLASAVERIALQAAAAPLPVAARTPAPPSARPALPNAAPLPSPPETRQKKTTDLTVEAETRAGVAEALPPPRPAGEPPVPPPLEASTQPDQTPAAAPPTLPSDPLAAWEACGEAVGGLATDFVAMAGRVAWVDDVLEASFPAEATTAVAFLSRPEMVAALNRALSEAAGRPLRHRIKQEPKTAVKPQASSAASAVAAAGAAMAAGPGGAERGGSAPAPPAPALGRSQAALLRDTLEHPLVIHARSLFDAAIRKVEQGRARVPAVEPTPVAAAVVAGDGAPLQDDDEETIDDVAGGDVD
jgi:DNA polymerase-3 subunit gamma/tau